MRHKKILAILAIGILIALILYPMERKPESNTVSVRLDYAGEDFRDIGVNVTEGRLVTTNRVEGLRPSNETFTLGELDSTEVAIIDTDVDDTYNLTLKMRLEADQVAEEKDIKTEFVISDTAVVKSDREIVYEVYPSETEECTVLEAERI